MEYYGKLYIFYTPSDCLQRLIVITLNNSRYYSNHRYHQCTCYGIFRWSMYGRNENFTFYRHNDGCTLYFYEVDSSQYDLEKWRQFYGKFTQTRRNYYYQHIAIKDQISSNLVEYN